MKKSYVKPTGKTLVINVNENIATSRDYDNGNTSGDASELMYTYGADGSKYIAFSTVSASNTGNNEFDKYTDLINAHIRGIYFACASGGVVPH